MNDKRLTSFQLNVPPQIDFVRTENADKFAIIHKFGSNMNIGTSVEDIQSNGGFYNWPLSSFKAEIVSTDPNDNSSGSGGRSVTIQGLQQIGPILLDVEETILLDGLTPAVGTVDFFRINKCFLATSGTNGGSGSLSHQGIITIQTEGAGEIHGELTLESGLSFGTSLVARFSIPSDARGSLQRVFANTASNKAAKYFVFQRTNANIVTAPFPGKRLIFNAPPFIGNSDLFPQNPLELDPATDIWFCGIGLLGSDNELTIDFELTLKYFDLP